LLVDSILVYQNLAHSLACIILNFRCDSDSQPNFDDRQLINSYVIVAEFKERRVGFDLGHRPSSLQKF
jgi:hypothetical protein